MATCPNCSLELRLDEQHFGTLYNCPKCSAIFFIDWNGMPEASSLVTAESESELEVRSESEMQFSSSVETEDRSTDDSNKNSDLENVPEAEFPPMSEEDLVEFAPNNNFDHKNSDDVSANIDFAGTQQDMDVISEIESFANAVDTPTTLMTYDVQISGIDTAELILQIREILEDSKFGWDIIQMMRTIRNGNLDLKGLSPTAAAIVVQRLKTISVEITWGQNVN